MDARPLARLRAALARHGWVIAAVAASAVPMIVTVVAVSGRPWFATGDYAHTELLVRAVPSHPPLVGVAARVASDDGQGSTPGPSMAYLLTPAYRFLGSSGLALLWSTVLLHVAGLGAAVALARRNAGTAAAVALALAWAVMTRALVPDFFLQPWNVWLPLYAFLAFCMLCWGTALGRVRQLPWAVAVGSHCVQTHVSYGVLVVGLLAAALTGAAARSRRSAEMRRSLAVWTGVATGVGLIVWLPPLVEELRPGTGNLTKLYHEFTSPSAPYVGIRAALTALGGELNALGPWVVGAGRRPVEDPNLIGLAGFVVVVGVGAWTAWKRRDGVLAVPWAGVGVLGALALFATSRVFGTFFDYVIRWAWPLAATAAGVAVWSWWRWWSDRGPSEQARRRARIAAGLTLAAVSASAVAAAVGAEPTYARDSRITEALTEQLVDVLDPTLVYRIEHHDPVALGSTSFGLLLALEREGLHVGIDESGRAGALPFRVVPRTEADGVLVHVIGDSAIEAMSARPDARLVAFTDVRTDDERARAVALLGRFVDETCAAGFGDLLPVLDQQYGHSVLIFSEQLPLATERILQEYDDLRLPAAVFLTGPGTPPFDASTISTGQQACQ